ncbi:hypothetical protein BLL52_0009 [Rhodoferax antarcticus ANT.BR]|uniref:Uncharacterized protein n=1 Tax=Rhodoferax antarcticus ANT.BR TaxID=1111071 RepID=A0A1Q8YK36_9BURK|nr:hypothetical protein BLL52_0009 [Rhodoferax antarcticus ANT.BR]
MSQRCKGIDLMRVACAMGQAGSGRCVNQTDRALTLCKM